MESIRTKLLRTSLLIVAVLSLTAAIFFAVNLLVIQEYKHISDNLTSEYRLSQTVADLIAAFNERVRSSTGDINLSEQRIQTKKSEIAVLQHTLDKEIVDPQSRASYRGLTNTINAVVYEVDEGMQSLKENNLERSSSYYYTANEKYSFVEENSTLLILNEIRYANSIRERIDLLYQINAIANVLVLIAISAGSVFYLLRFSSHIVIPLQRLTGIAKKIEEGDLDVVIDDDLLSGNDEIATLSSSYKSMLATLFQTIRKFETSNKNLQVATKELAAEKESVERIVVERTKQLREEQARLLASINSLSFGFVLADVNGVILIKNPALGKILGGEDDSLKTVADIGTLFTTSGHPLDFDVSGSCKECMTIQKPVEFNEISFGKKYLRVICFPVLTETTSIGFIFLVEDITEAKVMERSRDEFFAVASHELRTPLTAIRGNTDMILDMFSEKETDPDLKEMLEDIRSSSIRLISVVNDFLEVSRLEQGKIEITKEEFNVEDIARKVTRDLEAMAVEKKLTLVCTPPATPLEMVTADRSRTEQILLNLVGNAIKFTPEGGSITVTLTQENKSVAIRVIDTGTGISTHNQALLFRKFQQAGEQVLARDVTQSTGLGLYISRLIALAMGSVIALESSTLGKGSTFIFTLPLAKKTITV